jgi:hypothetical protein
MKRFLTVAALLSVALLTGCATQDYKMYTDTQRAIASANATAESAKYAALAEIARTGDSAAKVAAVMSINFGASNNNRNQQQIVPPRSAGDIALQWTSLLLPNLTQFYSINSNRQVAITQSNNATALGIKQSDNQVATTTNTNNTFANIAGAGLTAVTTTAGAGLTAVTTTAGAGLTAVTTTAGAGLAATVDVAKAGLTATTTVSGQGSAASASISKDASDSIKAISDAMKDIQPNVTTTNNTSYSCPVGQTLVSGNCV